MTSTGDDGESQRLLASPQNDNGTLSAREDPVADSARACHESPTTNQLIFMLAGPFVGAFLAAVDSTLVGTLGGAISSSLGDQRLLTWLGSSFFIATCVSQPIVGKITDIYGRKPVLLFANIIFCLGNLMCALTRSEGGFLAGRVIAGFGGGCIGPVTSFIMSDIIPLRQRGVWQGAANTCFGFGSGIGGPLGGWILQAFEWRWAFILQIPITLIAILLLIMTLPETTTTVWNKTTATSTCSSNGTDGAVAVTRLARLRRVDFLGSFSLAASLVLLLVGLNTAGSVLSWSDPLIIASLCGSVIFLGIFLYVEHAVATEAIIDLSLFRNRTLIAAWLTNWFASMARFGLLFYGPILFQVQGFSVRDTGLRFVPESVAIVVASVMAGAVMRATGKHYWLGVSMTVVQTLGLALLCFFTAQPLEAAPAPAWTALIFLFLQGFGYSGMLTTTLIAMIASAEQKWQAIITSTSYAFRSTGTVIGITIASVVFQNSLQLMILGSNLQDGDGSESSPGGINLDKLLVDVQHDLHYIDRLDEPLQSQIRNIYISALQVAFVALTATAGLALISASFIKQHKLHVTISRRD